MRFYAGFDKRYASRLFHQQEVKTAMAETAAVASKIFINDN